MQKTKLTLKNPEAKPKVGHKKIRDITISCSRCSAPLVMLCVTIDDGTKWKVRANCPHCGDNSFFTDVVGGWVFGKVEPEYTDLLDTKCLMNHESDSVEVNFITTKGHVPYVTN